VNVGQFQIVVGGIVAVLGALGALIPLVIKLIGAVKSGTVSTEATRVELAANTATTEHTAHLVNNKSDEDALWRQELMDTLKTHGIALPANPATAAAKHRIQQAADDSARARGVANPDA
jgi:hypothetical protein